MDAVENCSYMFLDARLFNQPCIWNMGNVNDAAFMFSNAFAFEGLGVPDWNLSNLNADLNADGYSSLEYFLSDTLFNGSLANVPWNRLNYAKFTLSQSNLPSFTSEVVDWGLGTVENQDLTGFFSSTTWTTSAYDNALEYWANSSTTASGVTFDAGNTNYSSSQQANRDYLTNTLGWSITDNGAI